MIRVTDTIHIDPAEIGESFVRASGPGGQNVNKLSTAVMLRFDVRTSPSLPEDVKTRLLAQAGKMVTRDGVLVIKAQTHRTQERNRAEALDRLIDMIARAAIAPKIRRATKPSRAAKAKRVEAKKARGAVKSMRVKPRFDD
ncbi:MAG TPA: alternative ribosome rescue aminoacyl-tRNA hydrolase ArfB [Micropepsaceae bacterium]|nr:alternative ribosome rescue aminoacyl-tRNA hydrolase ArfB [Micropepsaceae bacterium]